MTTAPPTFSRKYYTVADAARHIGVSRSTFYELLKKGEISARKLGSRTIVPGEELEKLIARQPAWQPRSAA
jgi:excisionase family DNA binding protein